MVNIFLGFLIYLLRREKEDIVLDIVLEMVFKIRVSRRFFFLESNMFVALEIEVESMEISCTLIPIMENGQKYIIFFLFCYTWKMLDSGGR